MKAEVQKAMGLLKQAMACLEGYEDEDGEDEASEESNAPEEGDDDLAAKSFKMKLSKYKG